MSHCASADSPNFSKHDVLDCILCEEIFSCLANRAHECPCNQVRLTSEQAEWIEMKTDGVCVCNACLLKLREEWFAVEKVLTAGTF